MPTRLSLLNTELANSEYKIAEIMAVAFLKGVEYGAGISPGKHAALTEFDLKARAITEVTLYLMEEVPDGSDSQVNVTRDSGTD